MLSVLFNCQKPKIIVFGDPDQSSLFIFFFNKDLYFLYNKHSRLLGNLVGTRNAIILFLSCLPDWS